MRRAKTMLCVMALVWAGCASPPKKEMDAARAALEAAGAGKDCAPEKYAAAAELLAQAEQLVRQEKYDEAARKAEAAEALAQEAKALAIANKEECDRRSQVVAEATREVREVAPGASAGEAAASLTTVYFSYDSADISPPQRERLDQNARWMRQNPGAKVIVEGHTDERGSAEYNLALGERRARSARVYLEQLGVEAERMRVLSYGEEKPVAYGQDESDYRSNRRVEFVPTGGR